MEIEKLPTDLEELYDFVLSSISQHDRILGSKYLQLVLRSMEISKDSPMALLQLSFANEEDYAQQLNSLIRALADDQEKWRCDSAEGRLRSRCCGLIEVQGYIDATSNIVTYGQHASTLARPFFHKACQEPIFKTLQHHWQTPASSVHPVNSSTLSENPFDVASAT